MRSERLKRNLVVLAAALAVTAAFCTACRSVPKPAPVDLSSPDWRVQHGQAIWKPTRTRPELTGELLLATNANGDFFVQFTKTPFTLATAQVTDGRWQIEFASGKYAWRGSGEPPARFVWFELPRALAGDPPHHGWRFTRENDLWRIEKPKTGESLEGRFFP